MLASVDTRHEMLLSFNMALLIRCRVMWLDDERFLQWIHHSILRSPRLRNYLVIVCRVDVSRSRCGLGKRDSLSVSWIRFNVPPQVRHVTGHFGDTPPPPQAIKCAGTDNKKIMNCTKQICSHKSNKITQNMPYLTLTETSGLYQATTIALV